MNTKIEVLEKEIMILEKLLDRQMQEVYSEIQYLRFRGMSIVEANRTAFNNNYIVKITKRNLDKKNKEIIELITQERKRKVA